MKAEGFDVVNSTDEAVLFPQAQSLVRDIQSGGIVCDVVLIDGNFGGKGVNEGNSLAIDLQEQREKGLVLVSITNHEFEEGKELYDKHIPKLTSPDDFIAKLREVIELKRECREGELHVI